MNFMIAYSVNTDGVNTIVKALKSYNIEFGDISHKLSYTSVMSELKEHGPGYYQILLYQYELERKAPLTVKNCEQIVLTDEGLLLIPVVPNEFKNSEYMQGLLDIGVYGALFEEDGDLNHIADIIKAGGRSRKDAKRYYGLSSASGVEKNSESVNLVTLSKYIRTDEPGTTLIQRVEYVHSRIGEDEFSVMLKSLPEHIKEKLIAFGQYDLYYAREIGQKQEKVKNKTKEDSVFSSDIDSAASKINKAVGVISLNRSKRDSSFTALNVARGLGAGTTLLELPGEEKLYDLLNLKAYGTNFQSYVPCILENKGINDIKNTVEGINLLSPNPYTDRSTEWNEECSVRTISALREKCVIDYGYDNISILQKTALMLTDMVVIIDERILEANIEQLLSDIGNYNSKANIVVIVDSGYENCPQAVRLRALGYKFIVMQFASLVESYINYVLKDMNYKPYTELMYLLGVKEMGQQASTEKTSVNIKNVFSIFKKSKKEQGKSIQEVSEQNIWKPSSVYEIGIGGIGRGVGCTHLVLSFAVILSKKYKVAVVEQNDTGAFRYIYETVCNKANGAERIPVFEYNHITFFPYCKYSQFAATFKNNYDYVLVDFGDDMLCSTYMSMVKKIIVMSKSPWKLGKINEIKDGISDIDGLSFIVPLSNPSELSVIEKNYTDKNKVYSVPYSDWENPESEYEIVLGDILAN